MALPFLPSEQSDVEWRSRAASVIPGGASTGSKRPDALFGPGTDFGPTHFVRASGCRVTTAAGAEIDLVLERGPKERYAIEIKRSLAPSFSKGFYLGCEDIGAEKRFLVYPGKERFPMAKDVTAIPLSEMVTELLNLKI